MDQVIRRTHEGDLVSADEFLSDEDLANTNFTATPCTDTSREQQANFTCALQSILLTIVLGTIIASGACQVMRCGVCTIVRVVHRVLYLCS